MSRKNDVSSELTPLPRLIAKHRSKFVIAGNGCWVWQRCTAGKMGYANVWCASRKKMQRAHRMFFEAVHGKIPKGLIARHRCDNPLCVNPKHICLGTQKDNMQDMHRRGRDHWTLKKKREQEARKMSSGARA